MSIFRFKLFLVLIIAFLGCDRQDKPITQQAVTSNGSTQGAVSRPTPMVQMQRGAVALSGVAVVRVYEMPAVPNNPGGYKVQIRPVCPRGHVSGPQTHPLPQVGQVNTYFFYCQHCRSNFRGAVQGL